MTLLEPMLRTLCHCNDNLIFTSPISDRSTDNLTKFLNKSWKDHTELHFNLNFTDILYQSPSLVSEIGNRTIYIVSLQLWLTCFAAAYLRHGF